MTPLDIIDEEFARWPKPTLDWGDDPNGCVRSALTRVRAKVAALEPQPADAWATVRTAFLRLLALYEDDAERGSPPCDRPSWVVEALRVLDGAAPVSQPRTEPIARLVDAAKALRGGVGFEDDEEMYWIDKATGDALFEALADLDAERALATAEQPRTEPPTEPDALLSWAREALDALIWCSGSGDFGEGGQAEVGWKRGPAKAIERGLDLLGPLPRPEVKP